MGLLHSQFHYCCSIVIFYIFTANLIQSPEKLLLDYLYNSAGFGSELETVAFMKCIILLDRLVLAKVVLLGDSNIVMHVFDNRKKCPYAIPQQDFSWN